MFDLQATIGWVTGVLKTPEETARRYREADPPWLQTFLQLPLPLIVAASVVAAILTFLTGTSTPFVGARIVGFLYMLVFTIAWSFVLAVIIDQLAGFFDGEKNFSRAYSVVGFAMVAVATGNALGVLPFIGWLINLAAGIYGIYLTYQFVPIFLAVPEESRVKHIVATIVLALVAGIVIGGITAGLGLASMGSVERASTYEEEVAESFNEADSEPTGGLFGNFERQAKYVEQADQDVFDPPADGELTEEQVERYVRVLRKTSELRDRLGKKFEQMDEENASISAILGGVGDAARIGTAEMEVVKTGGGNWAEHQWVRHQLEVARVQQDLNDTVKHNFALFEKYAEEIERFE